MLFGDAEVTAQRLTGIILVLGCALVLAGAGMYMWVRDARTPMIFGQPAAVWLRLVHTHRRLWRWATVVFMSGPLLTLLGQTLLAVRLRAAGDPGYAEVALVAVAVGAILWTINLAARLTVDPWAGAELARTEAIPESYIALGQLTSALFIIYTILTFAGLSILGGSLLVADILPDWIAWTAIVYGVAGLGYLAATRDAPPFLHYLMPLVMGIVLLLM
jgi:hypothetical protein